MATKCCQTYFRRTWMGYQPDSGGDTPECLEGCSEGLTILNFSDQFTSAGYYIDINAKQMVELDGSGNVVDTIPCDSGFINAYLPNDGSWNLWYSAGGPDGPFYWDGSKWVSICNFIVQNVDQTPPGLISLIASHGVGVMPSNVALEITFDSGANWETSVPSLTNNQLSGEVMEFGGVAPFWCRLAITWNGCIYYSATYTIFGP